MHEMYAPEECKEIRMCVRVCAREQVMDESPGHSSYYLLGWLLLSAGFGSVETDSSSPRIRHWVFAVDLCLVLTVLLHHS